MVMTGLHFIEGVIGIYVDYWPWFLGFAPLVAAAGFYFNRRNR